MDHGEKGKRGRSKILDRARHRVEGRDSLEKYPSIYKFLTNFETAYFRVIGCKMRVEYKGGYYYIGTIRWTHHDLERELIRLLKEEQKLNQLGDINGYVN